MATAIVTAEGQITLPAEVRDALRLEPGSEVKFIRSGIGQFTIVAAISPLQEMKGILSDPAGHPVSIEEMNAAIATEAARRYKESLSE